MCCGARSAPRFPRALSALWPLARRLPAGQAAVRALRVSPGLPGHSKYSTLDCEDLLGCLHENAWLQGFQPNKARPASAHAGDNALAVRRHCPRVYAAPIEVSLPPCIPMIDMLVTGIIRSVSAGVRFLQRAIRLSVGLHALVGIVHGNAAVLASILIRSTSSGVISSPVRS